ncbi:MAG: D-tyrosyl-tRNA(Tyr) deacylase [Candidatus Melainabacteria bacterium]|nr:D-tyrosyl-tRNA(Tyr) deacylase [Candidatus Melainabacteria bacterium]
MITLIQRVKRAKVTISGKVVGEIDNGLLLYIGFEDGDNLEKIEWSINKIINLRIFSDNEEKMNLALGDVNGGILAISNFTLPADLTESGRRPSFTKSAKPDVAEDLYNKFVEECKKRNIKTEIGKFGAMMTIDSIADGPVNFILKR